MARLLPMRLFSLLAFLLWFLGCAQPGAESGAKPQEEDAPAVSRAQGAQRVIALAPSVAELVFALGEGDRVIGVGDYVVFPQAAAGLPRLGGLIDPHLEQMVALQPDLAILLPSEEATRRHLEGLGIEVLTVASDSLDDVAQAARVIAGRLGVPHKADSFVKEWALAMSPASVAPRNPPLRVFLSVGRSPAQIASILSAGNGTFLNELLDRHGAQNLVSATGLAYPQVGLEEVLLGAPEVILELQGARAADDFKEQLVADWERFSALPAVVNQCVFVIDGDYVLVPGPRLKQLSRQIGETLAACSDGSNSGGNT